VEKSQGIFDLFMSADSEVFQQPPPKKADAGAPIEPPLVLIVDDDKTLQFLAGNALRKSGFSVVSAQNGEDALELFVSLRPQMVLLDVLMPGMDGFEVCSALRRLPGGDAAPVVMMTSLDDVASIRRAYEAGATDFITKPINWVILGHRVRYMIRSSETANELRRSEARNKAILDAVPDLMFRMNKDGVLLEVKGANGKDFLLPARELPGKRIGEVMPPEVSRQVMYCMERALEGRGAPLFEFSIRLAAGVRYYEARVVTCGEDEALCIVRDISERKTMEEDLLKVKKLEATGILAAGIAHDFNNILSVILANINVVEMHLGSANPDFRLLTEVEEAALRARDLTRRFITFSTEGAPHRRLTSVEALINDCASRALDKSNIEYKCIFPEKLWQIDVDEGQMRHVFYNIIVNAREAMPRGGIIRILAENMEVEPGNADSPLKAGKYVRISIEDQGIGIPRENLENVFDPYFSTKERCSRKGMGLGLTMAYTTVKKHDGHIFLESEPGVGTVFHLHIPASESWQTVGE